MSIFSESELDRWRGNRDVPDRPPTGTLSLTANRAAQRDRPFMVGMPMDPGAVPLHTLDTGRIPEALLLSAEPGWNQVAADWRLMIENGDSFGVSTEAGRLIASGADRDVRRPVRLDQHDPGDAGVFSAAVSRPGSCARAWTRSAAMALHRALMQVRRDARCTCAWGSGTSTARPGCSRPMPLPRLPGVPAP